jgi:hypothetical protein
MEVTKAANNTALLNGPISLGLTCEIGNSDENSRLFLTTGWCGLANGFAFFDFINRISLNSAKLLP